MKMEFSALRLLVPLAIVLCSACIKSRNTVSSVGGAKKPGSVTEAARVYRGSLKEAYPGLYCPQVYGLNDWTIMELRVRRNLSAQLLDLARVQLKTGQAERARANVQQALSVVLADGRNPAQAAYRRRPQKDSKTLSIPADLLGRPLGQRLRLALESGWFGAAALAYFRMFPGPDGEVWTPDMFQGAAPKMPLGARGVWWLMAAQHMKRRGDGPGSTMAARKAVALISQATREVLAAANKERFSDLNNMSYLINDPTARRFPWGWLSVDYYLPRLEGFLAEAAALSASKAEARADHQALRSRARALLRRRQSRPGLPLHITAEALAAVPTCDSSVDLLRQAGRVLPEARGPNHGPSATARRMALQINRALAAGDRQKAGEAARQYVATLRGGQTADRVQREMRIKKGRNELVRLFMVHGWHRSAERVIREALEMDLLHDKVCFNRESVLRQILARVRIDGGELQAGEAELARAISISRSFLEKIRRTQGMRDLTCEDRGGAPRRAAGARKERGPGLLSAIQYSPIVGSCDGIWPWRRCSDCSVGAATISTAHNDRT